MIVNIDTKIWMRPSVYAKKKGLSQQNVSNMVRRGKLIRWHVKHLEITLVAEIPKIAT